MKAIGVPQDLSGRWLRCLLSSITQEFGDKSSNDTEKEGERDVKRGTWMDGLDSDRRRSQHLTCVGSEIEKIELELVPALFQRGQLGHEFAALHRKYRCMYGIDLSYLVHFSLNDCDLGLECPSLVGE